MDFNKINKKNAEELNKAIQKNDEDLFKCIFVKKKGYKRKRKHLNKKTP